MKGLTLDQHKEILELVQKHHKFGWVPEELQIKNLGNLHIKYVDSCYDSRDNTIWRVTFRGGISELTFGTNTFSGIDPAPDFFKYSNLYDWVKDFLLGDWTNRRIIEKYCRPQKDEA